MPNRATIAHGLKVLADGTAGLSLSRPYRKTLRDRVRCAKQPTSTAKAICRGLRIAPAKRARYARVDISAAQEARAAQIRRQPDFLQSRAADEGLIAGAAFQLLNGDITQAAFDARMAKFAQAPLPTWMLKVEPTATELHARPPVRHRAGPVSRDPFPSEWLDIPPFLDRRRPKLSAAA